MTKSTLVVRIEFDNDKRPAVVDDLLSNMCSYDNKIDEYAVTFASWTDTISEKEKLERLAEMVDDAIVHANKGLYPGSCEIGTAEIMDIEAHLQTLKEGK